MLWCLLVLAGQTSSRRRMPRSEFDNSVEFDFRDDKFGGGRPGVAQGVPEAAVAQKPADTTVRPARRTRRRQGEQDRSIRTSSWSSWRRTTAADRSSVRFPSTTLRRPAPTRERTDDQVKSIVVFPCLQDAALRCEYRPQDGEYPYRCKWTALEEPK